MFRTASAALALLVLMVSGCADSTKEDLFQRGVELIDEDNLRGAVVLLRNALEKDQNFFEARYELARAYRMTDRLDSAEKELKKVMLQNPSFREARIELGKVYLDKQMPDEAMAAIGGLLKNDAGGDAEVLEIAGKSHAQKGEYSRALEYLKRACSLDGAGADACTALATVYLKTGRPMEARASVEKVLEQDPSYIGALYVLADIQVSEGDTGGAIGTYGRIVERRPFDVASHFRKGILHLKAGQHDEALSVADRLIKSHPKGPQGYSLRGTALFYRKDFRDAIVALQKSLSLGGGRNAHYFLGLSHYYEGELEQALSEFYRAMDLDPEFVQARVLASLILLKQGRMDEAVAEVKKVIRLDEENALAYNIMGSAYMAKGMYDDALRELNRAIEIDPQLVDAHVKKGLFSLSRGDSRVAEEELRTAVKVAPEVLNSRVVLASYYLKQGRYDDSIKVLSKGLNGEATDAILYNLIAEARLQQNRTADAVASLKKAKDSDPEYHAPYFNLALLYFLSGEREKAIGELESVAKRSPGNLKALLTLASLYENEGRDSDALGYYGRARDTGEALGYVELAKYHLRKGQQDEALEVLGEASKRHPSDFSVHEIRGKALIASGSLKKAMEAFDEFSRTDPRRGLSLKVNAYVSEGRPDKALGLVLKELKTRPGDLPLMVQVSRLYMALDRKEKAVENAREMIARRPESPAGYLTLAWIHRVDGRLDEAVSVLRGASAFIYDAGKKTSLYMMLGDMYALKKDYPSALAFYRKAEESKRGYIPAVFEQGAILHRMGRKQEAISQYTRVSSFSGSFVPALNNLAYIYAEEETNLGKALQLATRAYVLAPKEGPVLDTLGFVLLKSNRVEKSLEVLKRAAELSPDNPSIRYHIALAHRENGDVAETMENLNRALRLGDFDESDEARRLLAGLKKAGKEQ